MKNRAWSRSSSPPPTAPSRSDQGRDAGSARSSRSRPTRSATACGEDAEIYKQRNGVERSINRRKQWRGLATRCDTLPIAYQAPPRTRTRPRPGGRRSGAHGRRRAGSPRGRPGRQPDPSPPAHGPADLNERGVVESEEGSHPGINDPGCEDIDSTPFPGGGLSAVRAPPGREVRVGPQVGAPGGRETAVRCPSGGGSGGAVPPRRPGQAHWTGSASSEGSGLPVGARGLFGCFGQVGEGGSGGAFADVEAMRDAAA